jgi:two-component system CheB/CheR fusion protein
MLLARSRLRCAFPDDLLPKEVGVELPILMRKVSQDGQVHKSRRHRLQMAKNSGLYQVVMRPLAAADESASGALLFLVSFEFKKSTEKADSSPAPVPAGSSSTVPKEDAEFPARMMELEQELHLQSANEEMETTNEELQSSNDELTTLNEELAVKSAELRESNAGIENIQKSMGSPFMVVDDRLRVVRYNAEALKIFSLTPADVGNEITTVSARCELPRFQEIVTDSIRRGFTQVVVCESLQAIYQMRSMPYFDENKKIVGAILIFFDNTAVIRTQEKLAKTDQQIHAIIDGSDSLICLKDQFGRYLTTNSAFRELFGTDMALHLPVSVTYLSTTLVPLPGGSGETDRVATLSRDVSSYKLIEKDVRGAKDAAEIANRAKSDFLDSMSHELRTPLNVVLRMSHLFQEAELNSEQKRFAGSIERSGKVLLSST